jgi:hypothetical protein
MPDYTDSHLARLVTLERETRAYADVDALGTFATPWRERLAVLRCYLIICLESQKGGMDDIFTAKLSSYRREYDTTLAQARAATVSTGGTVPATWPSLTAEVGR